ncbi:putative glutamine amidotransferase, class II [Pyrococcus sp. ST04]|nr:putative glutamine amidotransferase, class II [Pyrococcus sp. ST04]
MRPLVEALIKASQNDPYKAARGRGNQHKDGWGYVLVTKEHLEYYRSPKPIFEDEMATKLMEKLKGFSVLLLHSRAASQGGVNVFNTQPFSYCSPHGYQLYFIHNGDLIKDLLLEGLKLPKERFEEVSDSYLAGMYTSLFLTEIDDKEIVRRFALLKPVVRTSLNTGGIIMTPKKIKVFATAYTKEDLWEDENHRRYTQLLTFYGADLFAVMSSTLELYTFLPLDKVDNGTGFVISVDFDKENFTPRSYSLDTEPEELPGL